MQNNREIKHSLLYFQSFGIPLTGMVYPSAHLQSQVRSLPCYVMTILNHHPLVPGDFSCDAFSWHIPDLGPDTTLIQSDYLHLVLS